MSRGDRLEPGSRPYRALRWLVTAAFKLNLIRFGGPVVWTLATNVGRKRSMLVPVPPPELPTDSAARAEWNRPIIIPFWR